MILNDLPNIGPITLNRLLVEFGGDPIAILSGQKRRLESVRGVGPETSAAVLNWRTYFDLPREEERLAQAGATFITARDPAYPRLLKEISDPPIGLYRKGDYACDQPCVAIVGSRRTTLYGQATAKKLGAELARLGFCVVSGLARGIDTAAHEGALAVGGRTVAVTGTGIDIIYPSENLGLYRRIAESGAVLSEFPFGRKADRQGFVGNLRLAALGRETHLSSKGLYQTAPVYRGTAQAPAARARHGAERRRAAFGRRKIDALRVGEGQQAAARAVPFAPR